MHFFLGLQAPLKPAKREIGRRLRRCYTAAACASKSRKIGTLPLAQGGSSLGSKKGRSKRRRCQSVQPASRARGGCRASRRCSAVRRWQQRWPWEWRRGGGARAAAKASASKYYTRRTLASVCEHNIPWRQKFDSSQKLRPPPAKNFLACGALMRAPTAADARALTPHTCTYGAPPC